METDRLFFLNLTCWGVALIFASMLIDIIFFRGQRKEKTNLAKQRAERKYDEKLYQKSLTALSLDPKNKDLWKEAFRLGRLCGYSEARIRNDIKMET